MDKDTKLIFVILAIIAVLVGVFIWKVATTKEEEISYENNNSVSVKEEREKSQKNAIETVNEITNEAKKLMFWLIAFLIIAVLLQGIAIYRIAEQEGSGLSWLAFIPYGQWYLIAKIVFDGDALTGIMYIIGSIINNYIWENNILDLGVSIIGLYILYRLFKKYTDRAKHNLGNLIAFEVVAFLLGMGLFMATPSVFTLALATASPTLVQGIYMYNFSKKISE